MNVCGNESSAADAAAAAAAAGGGRVGKSAATSTRAEQAMTEGEVAGGIGQAMLELEEGGRPRCLRWGGCTCITREDESRTHTHIHIKSRRSSMPSLRFAALSALSALEAKTSITRQPGGASLLPPLHPQGTGPPFHTSLREAESAGSVSVAPSSPPLLPPRRTRKV